MFALFYTFIYINDVKKRIHVLAKPQRSSLRIHLCASERSERAIFNSFTVKKVNFFTINVKFKVILSSKSGGGGGYLYRPSPTQKSGGGGGGGNTSPIPPGLRQCSPECYLLVHGVQKSSLSPKIVVVPKILVTKLVSKNFRQYTATVDFKPERSLTPPPPPGGGGGYVYVCILGMCLARDPYFSPEFPFRSIFSQITKKKKKKKKKSVPEHHHFTFFGGFCRSGDHHFQNFFHFNSFIASHGRLSPNAKRSAAPRVSNRPECQPDASWQFRRLAFSRSKWIKLVPEPRIFKLKTAQARSGAPHFYARPGARSGARAHFSLCRGTYLPKFGVSTPPPPPPPGV